jgi:hypothetical protein
VLVDRGIWLFTILGAEDAWLIIEDPASLSDDEVEDLIDRVENKTGLGFTEVIQILETTPLAEA